VTVAKVVWEARSYDPGTGVLGCDVAGCGEPVVFLSGGPGSGPTYLAGLAEPLVGRGWGAILLHQRGTGRSQPVPLEVLSVRTAIDDVAHLVGHLGGPLRLVGHSYGASLALLVSAFCPRAVRQVVLIGLGPLGPVQARVYFERRARLQDEALSPEERVVFEAAGAERVRAVEQHDLALFERAHLTRMGLSTGMAVRTAEGRDRYAALLAQPPEENPFAHKVLSESLDEIDRIAAARDVACPLLVIYGRQDFEPIGQAEELAALAQGPVTIELIEEAAHLPWLDHPDRVARAIDHFFVTSPHFRTR
jgi:pimeloyl-ACP methyl ester carboxylesterase